MEWSLQELPLDALDARIARLRAAMKGEGLDAFVAYTNLVRPAAVAYLTGFTPYWNEGLLLVPMTGRLIFATALSNRVAEWIRANNPVSDVVSTPRPGTLLGERLAKDPAFRRVGVLELDMMPSELAADLAAAAPAASWRDASALFAALRRDVDPSERLMLTRADDIAAAALGQAGAAASDAGALAGVIEKHARLAGAEEVHVAIAPDLASDRRLNRVSKPTPLADRFAVRASVAYKGSWVRRTRTLSRIGSVAHADAWFESVIGAVGSGTHLAQQIAAGTKSLPGATLTSWMAEGCFGSYPLSVVVSSRLPGTDTAVYGGFLVLTIELALDSGPWIGSAPALIAADAETR
jgi:hypothetical protein